MELSLVKGLSDKRILEINKMGIKSVEELIKNYPRSYLDLTNITPIKFANNYECVLTVAKIQTEPKLFMSKRMKYVKIYCSQGFDTFSIVWFNQPYVLKKLERDKEYLFYGRVTNKFGLITMTNPIFESVENNNRLKGIVPVYSVRGNITQSVMKNCILNGIGLVKPESVIPSYLINKYALSSLTKAYYDIHNPSSSKNIQNGANRIALEEYFSLISAFKVIKGDKKNVRINHYNCSSNKLKDFTKLFGFDLTEGQKNAINDIYVDMTSNHIMNRLIQGDVGSGKTAVSICALYIACVSGKQSVVLAPTEVLAKQNYQVVCKYLKEYNVVFLSGSMTSKEKKLVKDDIKSGKAMIVVGTHAILQDDVEFSNLSLCICDEQQRFGVAQRSSLAGKSVSTDMLVMSATPIPRTLSLIFYGDLDISTILDKPKNRIEIKTNIVPNNKYEDMLEFIHKQVKGGRQVYFVCPKIDGDEDGTIMSVTELFDDLQQKLPDIKIALLHGKMKDKEKNEVMQKFKDNEYGIIVSTTVIEVGVDVPNATIMVINNAERFGLSQLHQLRGRVGRSNLQSYCFLLCGNENDRSKERLNAIKSCSDGFKISEIDYDMRGGGDFLGERQSGRFLTTLGNLKYQSNVIFLAKKICDEAFENPENISILKEMAIKRYNELKDITLN